MNRSNSFIFNSEKRDFYKLTIRLLVFSIPFLLATTLVLAIDPFNFFQKVGIIPNDIKQPIAMQFNPPLWKLSRFEKNSKEYVLLGDSRMAALDTDAIKDVSGDEYANLAYGGASLREVIETFWLVTKKARLKRVFVGISLEKYNDYEITDRVASYLTIRENPAIYFINHEVWEASYYNVTGYLRGDKFTVGTPTTNKEDFWQEELQITDKYYKKYVEPKRYRQDLQKIADYCRENKIELKFVIFPTHFDAQKLIIDENLQAQNSRFRSELTSYGDVYDFDWPNDLTENTNNFNDPIHTNQDTRQRIITEIWRNELEYGKLLSCSP